jgi:hypothetical protein
MTVVLYIIKNILAKLFNDIEDDSHIVLPYGQFQCPGTQPAEKDGAIGG